MRETIKLKKTLKINGEGRKELHYDIERITGEAFLEADARAHEKAARLGKANLSVAETDNSLQYYLGIMAIVAEEPEIDVADLERIEGPDVINIYRIGRNFINGSAGEEEDEENPGSMENSLEEHIEDMPEPSIAE